MEDAYAFVASTGKSHAEMFDNHFVADLNGHYENLEKSRNWRSGGSRIVEFGSIHKYLYAKKSGLLVGHFDKNGSLCTMVFNAVEESTLKEMAEDMGITGVEDKCIRKGIANFKKKSS